MPKKSPHPHVSWREGRPRFQPDKVLRAAGYKGRDLRHEDGRWFTRGEAVDWSDAFVAELRRKAEAARGTRHAIRAKAPAPQYTLGQLFEDWQKSTKYNVPKDEREAFLARREKSVYSPNTIRSHKARIKVVESHDPSLWASAVDAISQAHMVGLYDELVEARGLSTARGTMLVLSAALAWGKRRGKYKFRNNGGVNPARDLGMQSARKRLRIGSRAEIAALIRMADHKGWPEMGDMIALGIWTGQRQPDRLLMVNRGLQKGRRIFRQMKTGAIVSVQESPQLEARMAAARERRAAAGIVNGRVVLDEQIWVEEKDGQPRRAAWAPFPNDGDRYRKRFAELRAFAIEGDAAAGIPPCPALLGEPEAGTGPFFESDLRATAVTWLAMAGATIPEICAITGHTLASATTILRHYLALNPEMADSAIAKMVAWFDADDEGETGL